MNRREKLKAIKPSYDPANPPAGTKLAFGVYAQRLGLSLTDMAHGTDVSRTAVANLLDNNWPVRADNAALQADLRVLFEARGATDHELQTMFHARGCGAAANRPESTPGRGSLDRDPTVPAPSHSPLPGQQTLVKTYHPAPEEPPMLSVKQALSPQAKRHFKLFCNPFDGEVQRDQDFFNGDDFRWVRESAWQCVQNSSFVAVVGESGAGKTTVLADLEARMHAEHRNVLVMRPSVVGMEETSKTGVKMKSTDVLHACINALEPNATMPQTLQARSTRAEKLLAASAGGGRQHLLVIEEAHDLPDATLKHLKRMHEMRLGRRPLMGILLIAHPELKRRLESGDPKLREVAQRCEIVQLLPLDNDLKAYLECRAAAANRALDEFLAPGSVDALRERLTKRDGDTGTSFCYPLNVNNMVTRAMNKAASLGVQLVEADVFKLI